MSANSNPMQGRTHEFRLTINGRPTPGASTLDDVINPATGQLLTTCARADKEQLDEAVAAAKAARERSRAVKPIPVGLRRAAREAIATDLNLDAFDQTIAAL